MSGYNDEQLSDGGRTPRSACRSRSRRRRWARPCARSSTRRPASCALRVRSRDIRDSGTNRDSRKKAGRFFPWCPCCPLRPLFSVLPQPAAPAPPPSSSGAAPRACKTAALHRLRLGDPDRPAARQLREERRELDVVADHRARRGRARVRRAPMRASVKRSTTRGRQSVLFRGARPGDAAARRSVAPEQAAPLAEDVDLALRSEGAPGSPGARRRGSPPSRTPRDAAEARRNEAAGAEGDAAGVGRYAVGDQEDGRAAPRGGGRRGRRAACRAGGRPGPRTAAGAAAVPAGRGRPGPWPASPASVSLERCGPRGWGASTVPGSESATAISTVPSPARPRRAPARARSSRRRCRGSPGPGRRRPRTVQGAGPSRETGSARVTSRGWPSTSTWKSPGRERLAGRLSGRSTTISRSRMSSLPGERLGD